jgi:ribonuclease PH
MRCSVCLEVKMLHWRRCSDLGRLNTEYRMPNAECGMANAECRLLPPASTPSRQARELLKRSGRTQEISA